VNYANRGRLAALRSVEQSGQSPLADILRAEGLVENGPYQTRTRVALSEWTKAPNKKPRKVRDERVVTETVSSVRLTLEGRLRLRELSNDWGDYLKDHPHHVEILHPPETEWHILSRHETAELALEAIRDDARYVAVIPPDEAEGVL
jgi:hypothetical protein